MSIFRTLVEDFIREVYVEGLSLEEACEIFNEDYYQSLINKASNHSNIEALNSKLRKKLKADNIRLSPKLMWHDE